MLLFMPFFPKICVCMLHRSVRVMVCVQGVQNVHGKVVVCSCGYAVFRICVFLNFQKICVFEYAFFSNSQKNMRFYMRFFPKYAFFFY